MTTEQLIEEKVEANYRVHDDEWTAMWKQSFREHLQEVAAHAKKEAIDSAYRKGWDNAVIAMTKTLKDMT